MVVFLFPSEPFSPRRVGPAFAREMAAVEGLGFSVGLVDAVTDDDPGDRPIEPDSQ
jgi:hypothetical protein